MAEQKQPECFGKCQWCEEEDQRENTPLYRVFGDLMCGSCANECVQDAEFYRSEYGNGDGLAI